MTECGKFDEQQLALQQNQPTILYINPRDGQGYQFQIVPNLVDATAIAAATPTKIEFTGPSGTADEAQLPSEDGSQVLARMPVEVQRPAGDTETHWPGDDEIPQGPSNGIVVAVSLHASVRRCELTVESSLHRWYAEPRNRLHQARLSQSPSTDLSLIGQ
jgi:hypothetical protein